MRVSAPMAVSALAFALPAMANSGAHDNVDALYARQAPLSKRDLYARKADAYADAYADADAEPGYYDDDELDLESFAKREAEAEPGYYDSDDFDLDSLTRPDADADADAEADAGAAAEAEPTAVDSRLQRRMIIGPETFRSMMQRKGSDFGLHSFPMPRSFSRSGSSKRYGPQDEVYGPFRKPSEFPGWGSKKYASLKHSKYDPHDPFAHRGSPPSMRDSQASPHGSFGAHGGSFGEAGPQASMQRSNSFHDPVFGHVGSGHHEQAQPNAMPKVSV